MSNESKNETVWSVIILALMMALSASAMMFGGQATELPNEDNVSAAAFHQDGYQIQYSMDFFSAPQGGIVVNDAITSDDNVTYIVGTIEPQTDYQFGNFSGSTGGEEKGFVAALTAAGRWSWVQVDLTTPGSTDHSRLNAIDLTSDGSLIVVGDFYGKTIWADWTFYLTSPNYPPFSMRLTPEGDVTWITDIANAESNDPSNGSANDVAVKGNATYVTGILYATIYQGNNTIGDGAGDAFVVKMATNTGTVTNAMDNCNSCNPNSTPRESGDSITVLQDGTVLVGVSYDMQTSFGGTSTGVFIDGASTSPQSDVAVWELSPSLEHRSLSIKGTNLTDTVVGIEELENEKYFFATNSGQKGRLLELGAGLVTKEIHSATEGYLKFLDIIVDHSSSRLELVGFGGYGEQPEGALIYEGISYFPTQSTPPNPGYSSLFVAEYSNAGYQYGQVIDLPPTHQGELQNPTTSITSQDGSVRVISITRGVQDITGAPIPQQVSFAGDDMTVPPNLGIVGHFEWDTDQDGIPNRLDTCNDNIDSDCDGRINVEDNCPNHWNFDQNNSDTDGDGDACDTDDDDDGVLDGYDSCPLISSVGALDENGDGCPDIIQDGCTDSSAINENLLANNNDTSCIYDEDGDGVPNGIDECEGHNDSTDLDNDGVVDGCDPLIDNDGDGVNNTADLCPGFDDAIDVDQDGVPDGCDNDDDNDGVGDAMDQCPNVHATANGSFDNNSDGCPDFCDLVCQTCPDCTVDGDDDEDGVPNGIDKCPNTNGGDYVNSTGCKGDTNDLEFIDTLGDCDPANKVNCQEEMIIAGVGGAGLFGGSIITRILRPNVGKGGKPKLDLGRVGDAKDAYDFIAKKNGKKVKKIGGSDHYFKPGVERQGAMSTAADTALDDYVED